MNELDMQKYIVDCVNHAGGFAFKMSHRFLVGVPDLMVKLPTSSQTPVGAAFVPVKTIRRSWEAANQNNAAFLPFELADFPAGILEVKQRDAPKSDLRFSLAVTPQQRHFLIRARQAGMPTGVVSFMQERGKGKRGLSMRIYTLTAIEKLDYHAQAGDHTPVAEEAQVMEQLVAWHRECGK